MNANSLSKPFTVETLVGGKWITEGHYWNRSTAFFVMAECRRNGFSCRLFANAA